MAQRREVRTLTTEQIETTIRNICEIQQLGEPEEIFRGKPNYTKEFITKWNIRPITKFGDLYIVYRAKMPSTAPSERLATTSSTISPLRGEMSVEQSSSADDYMYLITLTATRHERYFVYACEWFYYKLLKGVVKVGGISGRPQVYICPAYVISDTLLKQLSSPIMPCLYRLVPLTTLYPLLGSKNGLTGLTFDYRIDNTVKDYYGKTFPVIFDSDVIVKAINAIDGDVIYCTRVLSDVSPYAETICRKVAASSNGVGTLRPSGICDPKDAVMDLQPPAESDQ